MAYLLTSVSGNLISAASAGYAPTNSAEVSAIASAYQVVSATGTQLYAGTAHVTSINDTPISASRAGNAANASMANSAYYDGTGRLISSLPDSAAVSAIASAYAESMVSGKQDSSAMSAYALSADVSGCIDTVSSNSASWGGGATGDYVEKSSLEVTIGDATNSASLTAFVQGSSNTAYNGSFIQGRGNGAYTWSFVQGASNSATNTGCGIGIANSAESTSLAHGYKNSASYNSISQGSNNNALNTAFSQGESNKASAISVAQGINNKAFDSSFAQGSRNSASSVGLVQGVLNNAGRSSLAQGGENSAFGTAFAQGAKNYSDTNSLAQGLSNTASTDSLAQGSLNHAFGDSFAQGTANTATQYAFAQGEDNYAGNSFAQGIGNSASYFSLTQGGGNSASAYAVAIGECNSAVSASVVFGRYNLKGDGKSSGDNVAFTIGDGTDSGNRHDLLNITKDGEITVYSSTADTSGTGIMSALRVISAATVSGIDSATCSAIASAYAESAVSSKQDSSAMSAYALSADVSGCIDTVSANSATWASASAISAYALSADVSSTIDTVSANSAAWGTQVVTSLSGNANFYNQINSKSISSTVSYKARLDENGNSISALYNTVSAQSANWGGSALALSAGPGVKLEKVGDTLVASTDETVLWSGSAVMSATVTLNLDDDVTKYRYIDIYSMPHYSNHIPEMMRISTEYMSGNTDAKGSYTVIAHAGGGGMRFNNAYMRIINYTSIQLSERQQVSFIGTTISSGTPQNAVVKVVGVCKLPGA